MRKMIVLLLAVVVGLIPAACVYGASSVNVTVNAVVPNATPEITTLVKLLTTPGQNPWDGTTVTQMNFGELTHELAGGDDAGVWYSQKYFCLFIFANGFGHRYEIKSSCSGLTSGANMLPTGSFGLVPQYIADDRWDGGDPGSAQGPRPAGSVLGTSGPAITSNKRIYRSETEGSSRILRAFYSLPPYEAGGADPFPGYDPVPLTQASGTYSGVVTITIAAL